MVFPSIPAYLDPANWQQARQLNQQAGSSRDVSTQLIHHHPAPPSPPPPPVQPPHGTGGAGSIRPGSMADRALLANIPMPEAASKCPRCESANTKFCYFNNYSLSQPRHFCKTCRRYWTRGGALRNVPVGGGCRRNKRSKASSSKSSVNGGDRPTGSGSSSTISSNSGTSDLLDLGSQVPPLRFMAPLNHLTDFGTGDIGLNYGALSAPVGGANDLNFHMGSNVLTSAGFGGTGAAGASLLSMGGLEQWRLQQGQQFTFLGGLDSSSSGLYPFEGGAEPLGYGASQVRPKISTSGTQLSSSAIKMEENQELSLSRQFLGMGIPAGNVQYWGGTAAWTDLSSFSSSSPSNPL